MLRRQRHEPPDTLDWVMVLSNDAQRVIKEESLKTPGLETGGILVGTITGKTVHVTSASGPGPNADHQTHEFSPDMAFSQAFLDHARSSDDVFWVGSWHKHPSSLKIPSGGDCQQMHAFVKDPQMLNAFVQIITTTDGDAFEANHFIMDDRGGLFRVAATAEEVHGEEN